MQEDARVWAQMTKADMAWREMEDEKRLISLLCIFVSPAIAASFTIFLSFSFLGILRVMTAQVRGLGLYDGKKRDFLQLSFFFLSPR